METPHYLLEALDMLTRPAMRRPEGPAAGSVFNSIEAVIAALNVKFVEP